MPTKPDASSATAPVKRKISRKSTSGSVASAAASSASTPAPTITIPDDPPPPAAAAAPTADSSKSATSAPTVDPIRRAFFFEEEGNANCSNDPNAGSAPPLAAFAAVKSSLLSRLSEIAQLKSKTKSSAESDESQTQSGNRLEALRMGCMTDLMIMKRLNREAQFRLKRARELTASRKLEADSRHLQLQNLLYECRHLQREITRCQDFRSRHEKISLAPLDQFSQETGTNLMELSEHELTLARLRWELKQREQLAKQLRSGKREVAAVQADISEKRRRLDSLAPLLDAVAKAAEPVEAALGLDSGPGATANARWKAESTARLLPAPLYLLYCQLSAYAESGCLGEDEIDKPAAMTVEIIGDRDEAAAIRQVELDRLKSAAAGAPSSSTTSRSKPSGSNAKSTNNGDKDPQDNQDHDEDDDDDDNDEDEKSKSKKKKKKTKKGKLKSTSSKSKKSGLDEAEDAGVDNDNDEEVRRQLLAPHPLSVKLSLSVPNCPGKRLLLQFHYLTACRVVVVRNVAIEPPSSLSSLLDSGEDVQQLLDCLYPGDDARSAPSYAVKHAMAQAASDDNLLWRRKRDVGLAYRWAQRLAGMACSESQVSASATGADSTIDVVPDADLAFRGVADCIRRIRERANARLELLARLADLASGQLVSAIGASLPPIITGAYTIARPWQRVTYDAYCELECTVRLRKLVQPADLFFTAAISCGNQQQQQQQHRRKQQPSLLVVALCIPVDYPDRLPLFGLGIEADSSAMLTCSDDLDLHEIETEVNVYPTDFLPVGASRQDVLLVQLHRLILAIDVYLKGGAAAEGRVRGGRAVVPGRDRPYRYCPAR